MPFYVIEHHRLGVYCGHSAKGWPLYSWKRWIKRGVRYTTREDAVTFLETNTHHKQFPRQCRVKEKQE